MKDEILKALSFLRSFSMRVRKEWKVWMGFQTFLRSDRGRIFIFSQVGNDKELSGIKQAGIFCCRFDEELVANPPDNVMVVNWFPQHDLLGNTKENPRGEQDRSSLYFLAVYLGQRESKM